MNRMNETLSKMMNVLVRLSSRFMNLKFNTAVAQYSFYHLMTTVQKPAELFKGEQYYPSSEDQQITEMHRLENSKASKMVHLNVRHRA